MVKITKKAVQELCDDYHAEGRKYDADRDDCRKSDRETDAQYWDGMATAYRLSATKLDNKLAGGATKKNADEVYSDFHIDARNYDEKRDSARREGRRDAQYWDGMATAYRQAATKLLNKFEM